MNDRFDLRIITQPHSQVYWGYFRRLVFGNSSTKHNKLTYFSNSMLFCSDVLLPFSHIPRCIHAKTPDFPRLFEPRETEWIVQFAGDFEESSHHYTQPTYYALSQTSWQAGVCTYHQEPATCFPVKIQESCPEASPNSWSNN